MAKMKVGLVGLGEVAQIIHLPILQALADKFEIAACIGYLEYPFQIKQE
jgi:hypothetical protein